MGAEYSFLITKDMLDSYKLGEVKQDHLIKGKPFTLYYRPGEEIYVMEPNEAKFKTNEPETKRKSFIS